MTAQKYLTENSIQFFLLNLPSIFKAAGHGTCPLKRSHNVVLKCDLYLFLKCPAASAELLSNNELDSSAINIEDLLIQPCSEVAVEIDSMDRTASLLCTTWWDDGLDKPVM